MVSSSKILTVSYGTFSCTLEGFDNSFDTMKAIAEYFRDLAQDDRYFGAEPPVPDAEMLAKIAEREIARRVEARIEQGNLVLRPTQEAEPPQGDVAPAAVSGAALVAAGEPAAAALAEASDELVGDDLSNAEAAEAPVDVEALDGPIEDEVAIEEVVADLTGKPTAADYGDIVGQVEKVEPEVEDAPVAEDREEAAFEEVVEEEPAEDAPVHQDSVAEKLQRIRAVVSAKQAETPEYIEDEHAMSGPDGDGNPENDAIDVAETLHLNDAELDEQANVFADTIASLMEDQLDEDGADSLFADADDAIDDESDFDEEDNAEAEADTLRAEIAALQAELEQAKAASGSVQDYEADDDDTDVAADENAPLQARVLKVKRADFEAAIAAGEIEAFEDEDTDVEATLEEVEPEIDAPETAEVEGEEQVEEPEVAEFEESPLPGADDSSLSDEDEAALARELAELQAEISQDDDWSIEDEDDDDAVLSDESDAEDEDMESDIDAAIAASSEANVRKAVKMTNPVRAMLTDQPIEDDESSVDRLIEQTNSELDEPEGYRRRSAIRHLRAAVAATKADRILGGGKKSEVDEEEPYRDDLATAVRPRRPSTGVTTKSERPAAPRSAPLKLVAEQRVDTEDAAQTKPVRPRRVTRALEAESAQDLEAMDDSGFTEFAESVGAHTLPELLEAAAAYMSFVEGRDQFSRPQLMTKVQQAEGSESSREERLRSFGQLLRDGKLEKTGGGRFTASDSIGFKPDARAAG